MTVFSPEEDERMSRIVASAFVLYVQYKEDLDPEQAIRFIADACATISVLGKLHTDDEVETPKVSGGRLPGQLCGVIYDGEADAYYDGEGVEGEIHELEPGESVEIGYYELVRRERATGIASVVTALEL